MSVLILIVNNDSLVFKQNLIKLTAVNTYSKKAITSE